MVRVTGRAANAFVLVGWALYLRHDRAMIQTSLRTLPVLLAMGLGLASPAQTPFTSRIAEAEAVVAQHFRGEPLDVARARSEQEIDAFNARSKAAQAELEAAKAVLDQALAPGKEATARLKVLDEGLKEAPEGNDQEANTRYQARIQERNAFVRQVNELNAKGQKAVETYNARVRAGQDGLSLERTRVLASKEAVNLRLAAFEAYSRGDEDVAFFVGLNRILADLREAQRAAAGGDALGNDLARVRALRRELGSRAMAAQARKPHGLVVVEVSLDDEPAWLIVDTGATDTVVPQELLDAIGAVPSTEPSTLIVVGGQAAPRSRGDPAQTDRWVRVPNSSYGNSREALRSRHRRPPGSKLPQGVCVHGG